MKLQVLDYRGKTLILTKKDRSRLVTVKTDSMEKCNGKNYRTPPLQPPECSMQQWLYSIDRHII